ncbi:hypothetical protein [Mycobacterium sp. URHD0025]|uniref:hypothetical protein n=1 Tax=Mycobacterium sp. URHD0025 TaxID=1298864 RepID=UPI0012DE4BF9|nr:hypothetical protein [Mycobacterium sp. URHD0025]
MAEKLVVTIELAVVTALGAVCVGERGQPLPPGDAGRRALDDDVEAGVRTESRPPKLGA